MCRAPRFKLQKNILKAGRDSIGLQTQNSHCIWEDSERFLAILIDQTETWSQSILKVSWSKVAYWPTHVFHGMWAPIFTHVHMYIHTWFSYSHNTHTHIQDKINKYYKSIYCCLIFKCVVFVIFATCVKLIYWQISVNIININCWNELILEKIILIIEENI